MLERRRALCPTPFRTSWSESHAHSDADARLAAGLFRARAEWALEAKQILARLETHRRAAPLVEHAAVAIARVAPRALKVRRPKIERASADAAPDERNEGLVHGTVGTKDALDAEVVDEHVHMVVGDGVLRGRRLPAK